MCGGLCGGMCGGLRGGLCVLAGRDGVWWDACVLEWEGGIVDRNVLDKYTVYPLPPQYPLQLIEKFLLFLSRF